MNPTPWSLGVSRIKQYMKLYETSLNTATFN